MEEKLNRLKTKYLRESDRIQLMLRELNVDGFEFYMYEELQYGNFMPPSMQVNSAGIWFRAHKNMQYHLRELEHAYQRSQKIYQDILSIAKVTDSSQK